MNEVLIRKAKKGDKNAFCRLMDENAMIDSLPDEIKNMLDQTLLHK